jgi:RNA polymerase sigma factor (sigma-70 family)
MRSDLDLLDAWGRGDDAAGNELVTRHFESVFMFFDGKVFDGVEDLAQRTFLACLEARAKIRPDGSFRAYLFGIARNILLQHYARARRDARPPDAGVASVDQLGVGGSPSRQVARHEETRLLSRALRAIPLDLQIAIELFYWEDLSIAEIAQVIEVPPGTVKSRLHRARELLRERMVALQASPATIDTTMGDLERWAKALRADSGPPE